MGKAERRVSLTKEEIKALCEEAADKAVERSEKARKKSIAQEKKTLLYNTKKLFENYTKLKDYAENVLERFANPFIVHKLSSIALNSVSKFKVRVLPSILEYIKRFDKMPAHLLTAFGALIRFYKTDMANDSADVVEFMKNADTQAILKKTDYWGEDLSFLYDEVSKYDH